VGGAAGLGEIAGDVGAGEVPLVPGTITLVMMSLPTNAAMITTGAPIKAAMTMATA
jgi:hypothetical protein